MHFTLTVYELRGNLRIHKSTSECCFGITCCVILILTTPQNFPFWRHFCWTMQQSRLLFGHYSYTYDDNIKIHLLIYREYLTSPQQWHIPAAERSALSSAVQTWTWYIATAAPGWSSTGSCRRCRNVCSPWTSQLLTTQQHLSRLTVSSVTLQEKQLHSWLTTQLYLGTTHHNWERYQSKRVNPKKATWKPTPLGMSMEHGFIIGDEG